MLYKALHLEPEENVILEVRKHWIVFVGYAITLFVTAIFPPILYVVSKNIPSFIYLTNIIENKFSLFMFLYSLWLLFLWISFFVHWTTYYLDVWYVTEKRIIAIEQRGLFSREVSNLLFDKIQDVTLDVKGLIPTLLEFSDIRVQTASEDNRDFFMTSVRHPEEVRRIIFSHQKKISDSKLTNGV